MGRLILGEVERGQDETAQQVGREPNPISPTTAATKISALEGEGSSLS